MAIKAAENCSRLNLRLLFLHDIAKIHYSRNRYADACEIWEPISHQYIDQDWKRISIFILENLAVCHKGLGRITAFIKTCFHLVRNPKLINFRRMDDYFRDILIHTPKMEDSATIESPNFFQIHVISVQNKFADDDVMTLTVSVENLLEMVCTFVLIIKDVPTTEIFLILRSADLREIDCRVSDVILSPGKNTVELIFDVFFKQ
jgi:hypothetical protein